jgi:hypothetical protein
MVPSLRGLELNIPSSFVAGYPHVFIATKPQISIHTTDTFNAKSELGVYTISFVWLFKASPYSHISGSALRHGSWAKHLVRVSAGPLPIALVVPGRMSEMDPLHKSPQGQPCHLGSRTSIRYASGLEDHQLAS